MEKILVFEFHNQQIEAILCDRFFDKSDLLVGLRAAARL